MERLTKQVSIAITAQMHDLTEAIAEALTVRELLQFFADLVAKIPEKDDASALRPLAAQMNVSATLLAEALTVEEVVEFVCNLTAKMQEKDASFTLRLLEAAEVMAGIEKCNPTDA